jgi:hypothetical protein
MKLCVVLFNHNFAQDSHTYDAVPLPEVNISAGLSHPQVLANAVSKNAYDAATSLTYSFYGSVYTASESTIDGLVFLGSTLAQVGDGFVMAYTEMTTGSRTEAWAAFDQLDHSATGYTHKDSFKSEPAPLGETISLDQGLRIISGITTIVGAGMASPGASVSNAVKGGTTVLGHYPAYTKLATELGARRFQIPTSVWNKMSAAEQWTANTKFLDRMILRGDNIRLATPLNQVKPGSFFQKELNY